MPDAGLDVLLVNGVISTGDPARPAASQAGIRDGRVVGLDEQLDGPLDGRRARRIIDLDGAYAYPGFIDPHFHLSAYGQKLMRLDVSSSRVGSLDALYAAVAEHARSLAPEAWVLADGLDDSKTGGPPTREALDAAAGGRPAWIGHTSHHAGFVNTAAIHRMGYADIRDLPDVASGIVGRDDDGTPTGYLAEAAIELAHQAFRPEPMDDFAAAIAAGARGALSMGLTSVTEPGLSGVITGNGPDDVAAFRSVREQDRLGLRVTLMPEYTALTQDALTPGTDGPAAWGQAQGLGGVGDEWLAVGGVKLFSDGAISGRTAAVTVPYVDPPDGGLGILFTEPEVLAEQILTAHRAGWTIATHAIGDRAIEVVLDAYEQARRLHPHQKLRHRIEHSGLATDQQLARMLALDVVPVLQARFMAELGDVYLRVLGEERGRLLYRQRSLLDAGMVLAGSSDCPVVVGNPLQGMQTMVTRRLPGGQVHNPDERITPHEAMTAFTAGSAYVGGHEHQRGRLAPGYLADVTVLADDVNAVEPDAIGDIAVVGTIVGGNLRHGDLAQD